MARLSISMKNELVRILENESIKRGKTVSSILSEAANLYLGTDKAGLRLEDIQRAVKIIEIMHSIDAVPVPSILLDHIVKESLESSDQEITKSWYDRGMVLGNIMRTYARDFHEFSNFIKDFRFLIPIDMLEIECSNNTAQIVLSGVGNSIQAARCTSEGIKGLLNAYEFEVDDTEISEGFVKIRATEKNRY